MQTRWREIVRQWRRKSPLWFLPGLILGFSVGVIAGLLLAEVELEGWFIDGFWPEFLGIVITVGFINVLYRRLDDESYKKDLIRKATSSVREVAIPALEEMLRDGLLSKPHSYLRATWFQNTDWKTEKPIVVMDADFEECRFYSVTIKEFHIFDSSFENASIICSDLSHSFLGRVNFSGSNLRGSKFERSEIEECNFNDVKFWSTNLSRAIIKRCSFVNANFQDADLTGATAEEIDLHGLYCNSSKFVSAKLNKSDFSMAILSRADFSQCNLTGAKFQSAELNRAYFIDATLWKTDFSGAKLWRAKFQNAMLEYTDFSGATLLKADFRNTSLIYDVNLEGAIVANVHGVVKMDETTRLPDETLYDPDKGVEQLKKFGCIIED